MEYPNWVLNDVIGLMPDSGLIIVEGNKIFSGKEDVLVHLEKRGIVELDTTEPGPVVVAAKLTEYGMAVKKRGGL
jgi:hypothetical protein